MKRLILLPILMIVFSAMSPAVALDKEEDAFMDRLARVENFDPTKAFLLFDEGDSERDALVEDILGYADTFVGTPYRRGSKGPKAFDCSGFTSFVFSNFGISLSASSSTQYTQGESVDLADVQPGDLLFFSGSRGGTSRVGHVALAVDVDDNGVVTFIHASTSQGVRYDQYPDGGYYSKRFIGVRRVVE